MANQKVTNIYNLLSANGLTKAKDVNEFSNWMAGSNYRQNIYGLLKQAGVEGIGSGYGEFTAITGYGKKQPANATQKAQSIGQSVFGGGGQTDYLARQDNYTRPGALVEQLNKRDKEAEETITKPLRETAKKVQNRQFTPQKIQYVDENNKVVDEDEVYPVIPKEIAEDELNRMAYDKMQAVNNTDIDAQIAALDKETKDIFQNSVDNYKRGQKPKSLWGRMADVGTTSAMPSGTREYTDMVNAVGNNPEYKNRVAALNLLKQASYVKRAAEQSKKSSGVGGWFEDAGFGMKEAAKNVSTWDMGSTLVSDAKALYDAAQKFDNGEKLSESEQQLLNAAATYSAFENTYGNDVSSGVKAGQITMEALPFMAEMLVNPASGTGRALQKKFIGKGMTELVKNMVKSIAKKEGRMAAAKELAGGTLARVGGDLLGAAVMAGTTGAQSVAGDTYQRMQGQSQYGVDANGNIQYSGRGEDRETNPMVAAAKAFGARTIENHSEMVGAYFAPALGIGGKVLEKGLSKMKLGGVVDFIKSIGATKGAKLVDNFFEKTKWDGTIGEYAEEVVGGIENALVVGDQTLDTDPETGVFNLQQNVETFLSVALMGGFMSSLHTGTGALSYAKGKQQLNRADYLASEALGEEWSGIKQTIDHSTTENASANLSQILSDPNMSPEQKRAVREYARRKETLRGVLYGEEARKKEKAEEKAATRPANIDVAADGQTVVQKNQNGEVVSEEKFDDEEEAKAHADILKIQRAEQDFQDDLATAIEASEQRRQAVENGTPDDFPLSEEMEARVRAMAMNQIIPEGVEEGSPEYEAFVRNMDTPGTAENEILLEMMDSFDPLEDTYETVSVLEDSDREEIDKAIKTDPVKRTERQQKLVSEVAWRLHMFNFPKGELHPEQSYADGQTQADLDGAGTMEADPEAMLQMKQSMDDAQQALDDAVAQNTDLAAYVNETINSNEPFAPEDVISGMIGRFSDDEIATVADYINAQSKLDGYLDYTQGKMQQYVERETSKRAFKGKLNGEPSGNMVMVTDGENRYFLVNGDVQVGENGEILSAGEANGIVVVDEAGNIIPMGLDSSLRVEMGATLEEYAASLLQQQQENTTAQMGFEAPVEEETAEQPSPNPSEEGNAAEGEPSGTVAPSEEVVETPQETEQEETVSDEKVSGIDAALAKIPTRSSEKDGEPDYIWEDAPSEDTIDALAAINDGNMDAVSETATMMRKEAESELKKAEKLKTSGKNPIEMAKSRAENRQKAEEAQKRLDYWKTVEEQVKGLIKQAEEAPLRQAEEEDASTRTAIIEEKSDNDAKWKALHQLYDGTIADDGEILDESRPMDINELVAMNMPRNIAWESYTVDGTHVKRGLQDELGSHHTRGIGKNVGTNAFNTFLAKKGTGISIDEAIHQIWESGENELANGEKRFSDQEIRNAVIDMFLSAEKPSDITNYVVNNRSRLANEKMRQEEEYMREQEANAYADAEAQARGFADADEEADYNEFIAEEIKLQAEYEQRTEEGTAEQMPPVAESVEGGEQGEGGTAESAGTEREVPLSEPGETETEGNTESSNGDNAADGGVHLEGRESTVEPSAKPEDTGAEKAKGGVERRLSGLSEAENDRLVELRKKLKNVLNRRDDTMKMEVIPGASKAAEIISIGTEIGFLYAKNGMVKFREFCENLILDIGEEIRPYLKSIYNAARYYPGMEDIKENMSSFEEVDKFDVANFDKETPDLMDKAKQIRDERKVEKAVKDTQESINYDKQNGNTVNVNKTENNEPKKVVSSPKERDLFGDSAEYSEREDKRDNLIEKVRAEMASRVAQNASPLTMSEVKKMAAAEGLEMKDTDLQELVETAAVMNARAVASVGFMHDKTRYDRIVKYYQMQPLLNKRDSDRVEKQQYSTPTPFAYLMGMFMKAGKDIKSVLEPSAGNGALTICFPKDICHVNDIDHERLVNLRRQGFKEVTSQDGTKPFEGEKVDGIVTNPPFGSSTPREYDGHTISSLEGQMAINALDSMKDDGRAAIIIGGNTEYGQNGAIKGTRDKSLMNYLYDNYNVIDVINIAGELYGRNGTKYPTRMILIAGRRTDKNTVRFAPVFSKARPERVTTFDELYNRVEDDIRRINEQPAQTSASDVRDAGGRQSERQPGNTSGSTERVRPTSVPERESNEEQPRPAGRVGNGDARQDASRPVAETGSNEPSQSGGNERTAGEPAQLGGERLAVDEKTSESAPKAQNIQPSEPKKAEKAQLGQEKVAYPRRSRSGEIGSVVPANQSDALTKVFDKFDDIDQYLVDKLGYSDKNELYSHLAAEQIDSVALAIAKMEEGGGFIIGDMTGVGKGRQAAALIRYAVRSGKKPIFFTVKKTLFSDIYRDLVDIGSKDLKPFIFATKGKPKKSDDEEENKKRYNEAAMTDEEGNLVYDIPKDKETERVLKYVDENGTLPPEYDYAVTTYDAVKSGMFDYKNGRSEARDFRGRKVPALAKSGQKKRDFVEKLAKNNFVIMDESHNASGDGGGSGFMQHILPTMKGVTFLSATFAKRPDNMPLYAMKTAMSKAGVKADKLIEAIKRGGTTLQEIMSRMLTEAGEMIRRERDFTGVTIDWLGKDPDVDKEEIEKQEKQFDALSEIFSDIVDFQTNYVQVTVDAISDELAEMQADANFRQGTKFAKNSAPFASKMYNLTQQLLFSLKVNDVVNRVISDIKAGLKPVIAVNNTMEGFIDDMPLNRDMEEPDLSSTLIEGLDGCLRITENHGDTKVQRTLSLSELTPEAQRRYKEIAEKISKLSTGLTISPIDAIKNKLKAAGYSVGELTGRKSELRANADGTVRKVERMDTDKKKIARDFNNGKIDIVILNRSASTGISLHSSTKFKDQRQRVMVFAQQQADINEEVQMRGRIDRTGQVHRAKYEYIVSNIPAEQRLLMMFKAKLKSLDANTTASQKSKFNEMETVDVLNKYGDDIVAEYMAEHPEIYDRLADPLKWNSGGPSIIRGEEEEDRPNANAATKVLGKLTLLPVKLQQQVLDEITERYKTRIAILDEAGENDLVITELPLKAKTVKKSILKEGVEPGTSFGDNTYLEKVEVDVLKKPMKAVEVKSLVEQTLDGKTADEYVSDLKAQVEEKRRTRISALSERRKETIENGRKRIEEKTRSNAEKTRSKGGVVTEEQIQTSIRVQMDNIKEKANDTYKRQKETLDNSLENFETALDGLKPGMTVVLPEDMQNPQFGGLSPHFGMFIGFKFNKDLTPSGSTAIFAALDGRRRITVPINNTDAIKAIISRTNAYAREARVINLSTWDRMIPTATRKNSYIITGNILQGLVSSSDVHGKLVSYTTDTGEVKQGVLMGESFEPRMLSKESSITTKLDAIRSGEIIESSDHDITIGKPRRFADYYELRVPLSKQRGGKYFLDRGLRNLVDDGEFETSGTSMRGVVREENLEKVLNYLSKNFGTKVTDEFEEVDDSGTRLRIDEEELTDSQGNPVDENGKLILEKVSSVDEITDEDFTEPSRNIELPKIPDNVDKAIGANGKPVIIKKNIFGKNNRDHRDLSPEQSRDILNAALYSPNLYGQNKKRTQPYRWIVINTKDAEGNNRLVLLEVNETKDNVEIVHWHYIRDTALETMKRQAKREGGHILILPSDESEEGGGLSARTLGLSSNGKDSENSDTLQENQQKNDEISPEEVDDSGTRFRIVEDEDLINELESGEKVTVYRAMQLQDGKLYPPMAAKVNGQWQDPLPLDQWSQADEHPELVDKNGKFNLDKGNGKMVRGVVYAPYMHGSTTMLNDQFKEAQDRPELVVVEAEMPASELTSGYQAEKSPRKTGMLDWKAGTIQGQLTGTRQVMLSRWVKPIRIVPSSEVAANIKEMIDGQVEVMPTNVVTPEQREELEKLGVKFVKTDNKEIIQEGEHKGEQYSTAYGKKAKSRGTRLREGRAATQTQPSEKMKEHLTKLSKKIGTKVVFHDDASTITNAKVKDALQRGKRVAGWFDPKDNSVHFYMPNIKDRYEAEKTIWHEVVGHKGMRALLGEEGYRTFMRRLWMDKSEDFEEMHQWVVENYMRYGGNLYETIDEWFAYNVVEPSVPKTMWDKVMQVLSDVLRKLGFMTTPNMKDMKYMLWLSRNAIREGDAWSELKRNATLAKLDLESRRRAASYSNDGARARDGFANTPTGDTEREMYRSGLMRKMFAWTEAHQDYMASAKLLMDAILKGRKVLDKFNFYMKENHADSKIKIMEDLYVRDYCKPMEDAINRCVAAIGGKLSEAYEVLEDYMAMKHGLERNREFFVRDWMEEKRKKTPTIDDLDEEAKSEYESAARGIEQGFEDGTIETEAERDAELKKALEDSYSAMLDRIEEGWAAAKSQPTDNLAEWLKGLDDYIRQHIDDEYEAGKHDYSGLTSFNDNVNPNLEDGYDYDDDAVIGYVMDMESKIGKENVDELWNQKARMTQFALDIEHEAGLITDKNYDKVSQMFHWYMPLRKWDEDMAEDIWSYMNSKKNTYVGRTLMKAGGRKSRAAMPIGTMFAMGGNAISRAARNEVKKAFAGFVRMYERPAANNDDDHDNDPLVTELEAWVENLGTEENPDWVYSFPDIPENATADEVREAKNAWAQHMLELMQEGRAMRVRQGDTIPYRFESKKRSRPEHIIEVYEEGQPHFFIVNDNPRAAQAINGQLKPETKHKITAQINRFMSSVFTSYSPTFMARNAFRDAEFASSMLSVKEGWDYCQKFIKNYMKVTNFAGKRPLMFTLFRKFRDGTLDESDKMERYFKEFAENGGITGYVMENNAERWEKEILAGVKEIGENQVVGITKNIIKRFMEGVEHAGEAIENAARFATYVTSRESGRTVTKSVNDAKEVSVNFNRKGAGHKTESLLNEKGEKTANNVWAAKTAQYMRANTLFYNASLQGIMNTVGNAARKPWWFAAKFAIPPMVLGALVPVFNAWVHAMLDDDDDKVSDDPYADLPEYTRRMNMCLYIGHGKFLMIPLSIEHRAFFGLGDIMAGQTYDEKLRSVDKPLAVDAVSQLTAFSPVDYNSREMGIEGVTGWGVGIIVPAYISPLVNAYFNKSWTGSQIQKENAFGGSNLPEYQKAKDYTNKTLVGASRMWHELWGGNDAIRAGREQDSKVMEWIGEVSPAKMEYVVEQYFGEPGKLGTGVSDMFSMMFGNKEADLRKIPVVKAFATLPNDNTQFRRANTKYWNYRDEFKKVEQDDRQYRSRIEDDPVLKLEYENKFKKSRRYKQWRIYHPGKGGEGFKYKKNIEDLQKRINAEDDLVQKRGLQHERNILVQQLVDTLDNIE